MKKLLLSIILLLSIVLISCSEETNIGDTNDIDDTNDVEDTTDVEDTNKTTQTKGVWWWHNESNIDDYYNLCKDNQVNEIYYSTSKFDSSTINFINEANKLDINVYLLAGEKEWINDDSSLISLINKYNAFQEENNNLFKGIHLDIEPHQFSDFSTNRNTYLTKLVNLVGKLNTNYSNIKFDYDIPFWLDDEVVYNNTTKKTYEHIIDLSSRAFIMSYRDTYNAIYDVAKDELDYATSAGKTVVLGLETKSSEGDSVSFQEEGSIYMKTILDELYTNGYSLAIHHIDSWLKMEENPTYIQDISYVDSLEKIDNPDQGFYVPISVKVDETKATYSERIIKDTIQLYHLRIDISSFSSKVNGNEDLELTTEALNSLESLFKTLNEKEKSAIVRFAYDEGFDGNSNAEPSITMIKRHIEQVSTIINRYQDMVTAVEVGLVGPWGEMHTSEIATYDNINILIETYLNNTISTPILVRTPRMIYSYLGVDVNTLDEAVIEGNTVRLGLFNDGYLGSNSDLGTYVSREKEIEWLSQNIKYLPFGGEVTVPTSTLHDIDNCVEEMFKMNLSYLNIQWNDKVIEKWKETYYTSSSGNDEAYYGKTAFEYIENHLGYRLNLTNSTLIYGEKLDELKIKLDINNVGFGDLTKSKDIKIIIVDENDNKKEYSLGKYTNQDTLELLVNDTFTKGSKIYLSLSNNDKYSIKLANTNIYDEELKANLIGYIQ